MRRLIFGCGYLGRRVADRWREAGDTVFVVTRDARRATEFSAAGFAPLVADVTDPAQLAELPEVDTVLFAVGFDRTADKTIDEVYVGGLENVLAALPGEPQFVYVSSVGVYGQTDGSWVDEQSPCEPARDGGRACLAAEQRLATSRFAGRSVALRLAGIYGPGRIPVADKIAAGESIANPPDSYLNLIHVDDAAQVIVEVARHSLSGKTYCVADGQPALRRDYYAYLAELLDAPAPSYTDDPVPAGTRRRGAGNKRIRNARLLTDFNLTLMYPSYREGLAAIVAAR